MPDSGGDSDLRGKDGALIRRKNDDIRSDFAMKILISGAGIAGLTLSFWLRLGDHDLTVVEKAPSLRDEGYMIDFFGSGYDVSERMLLLGDLEKIHYQISRLAFVDAHGREKFSISYPSFRRLFDGRHFNFMRGDLERLLYSQIQDHLRIQFGMTVESLRQEDGKVEAKFSDGATGVFDLVVGADGAHSQIRKMAFGEEERFSHFLGYYTAAFIIDNPPESLTGADAFYILTAPERQVGVYPIRGDRLATFFVYKARRPVNDFSLASAVRELHNTYDGIGWIVPELLAQCERSSLYFDEVSQIEMPRWSQGRVVLVGDACQCVSLLAGQGASMAMAGAYVLAQELAKAGRDVAAACAEYERKVKPGIEKKQKAGRRLARWFVPDNRLQLLTRDLVTRMTDWPIARRAVKRALAPESIFRLPPRIGASKYRLSGSR
jgi:2-polyprenyl-6-methoxyphenol hydroxylase-like FAD-dependent oxidoreductase